MPSITFKVIVLMATTAKLSRSESRIYGCSRRLKNMKPIASVTFLRRVLFADAATCIASGLVFMLGSGFFGQFLGLPVKLLQYAGISLLPFGAFLIYLALHENPSQPAVWTIILLNVLWTVDSVLLLLTGWTQPTLPGIGFVLFQAFAVAIFAALEYFGLRKLTALTV
jgi:hypothetical protein